MRKDVGCCPATVSHGNAQPEEGNMRAERACNFDLPREEAGPFFLFFPLLLLRAASRAYFLLSSSVRRFALSPLFSLTLRVSAFVYGADGIRVLRLAIVFS